MPGSLASMAAGIPVADCDTVHTGWVISIVPDSTDASTTL